MPDTAIDADPSDIVIHPIEDPRSEAVFQFGFRNRADESIDEATWRETFERQQLRDLPKVAGAYSGNKDGKSPLAGLSMTFSSTDIRGFGLVSVHVVVDRDLRRRGIGTRLLQAALKDDTRTFWTFMDPERTDAAAFLRSFGLPAPEPQIRLACDARALADQAGPMPDGTVFKNIPEDCPELADSFLAIRRRAFLTHPVMSDIDGATMIADTRAHNACWTGALVHGEPAGAMWWSVEDGTNACLGDLFVKRKFWGTPLGLALLHKTGQQAVERGLTRVTSLIRGPNAAMLKLAKKIGAVEEKRIDQYTVPPEAWPWNHAEGRGMPVVTNL